ncbi:MAG: hypothetical protein LBS53_14825 [Synergistaceae bacterium]|jgi:hypothetical protein|nr:hypothetical protein [Synergistaceae bacterium]
MSRELMSDIGASLQDNLIAGPRFPVQHKGVQLAAGQGPLKRGTVLAILAGGEAVTVDSSHTINTGTTQNPVNVPDRDKPDCVLAEDIDTGAVSGGSPIDAVAYSAGYFIRGSLIFGGSDTWGTHETEMRKLNMHLSASIDKEGGIH